MSFELLCSFNLDPIHVTEFTPKEGMKQSVHLEVISVAPDDLVVQGATVKLLTKIQWIFGCLDAKS